MNACSPPPSCRRRLAAVPVGLFATWQLVALPLANLVQFVPLRPVAPPLTTALPSYQARGTFTTAEPVQRAADRAGRALELWTEASGQEQGWSLFAPGPPPHSVFVAAELRWADGTADTVRSRYEPADPADPPVRAPLIHNRHYNHEVHFVYPVWYASPWVVAEHPGRWAGLPDAVRALRPHVRAWLRDRMGEYLAANPHRGRPEAVVLKHRYIRTPGPDEPPGAPRDVAERPFARWNPATDEIDAFDLVTMRFVPLGGEP